MSRSNYRHQILQCAGRNVIAIENLNIGGMSVTNNIENVVDEIAAAEKIDPQQHMIVYKDSDGVWDGWDYSNGSFISLQEDDYKDAVDKYILKQLQQAMA